MLRFAKLLLLLSFTALAIGQTHQTKPLDPANMDTSVKPTDDFSKYANGGWVKNNPIPADQSSWGSFNELRDHNLTAMHSICEDAAAKSGATKGSNEQLVGDLYFSGMDSVAIEAAGAHPLDDELKRIAAMSNAADVNKEIAHFQIIGVNAPFGFGSGQDFKNSAMVITQLGQDGIGLPDRTYYVNADSETVTLRGQYKDHVAKMFVLLGDDQATAQKEAATIMDFETELAKVSMINDEMRDPDSVYHKMNISGVKALAPGFDWDGFFKTVKLADPGDINVAQPAFFREMNKMITGTPVDSWKTYFRWRLVNASASFLSSAFVQENFNFNGTILSGQKAMKPRWKRIISTVDGSIGDALGQLYVAKYFPPEAKKSAYAMILNLKAALHDHITKLTWMSDETKKQALTKLDAYTIKVGYPDKWKDYSSLSIDRGAFAQNMLRVGQYALETDVKKIGKPVDRMEWGFTPPTVNAGYNPLLNEIVFPAGILQPPFFDPNADDAVNYGGIGAGIGHEMTHGFDDQGRQFDAQGNLKNWWTSEDSAKFVAATSLLVKQFSGYVAIDTLHVNGHMTLGENIADFGGLTISYAAFKKATEGKPQDKIDGLTPDQRFFLAWAQVWRTNYRPQSLKLQVKTNEHSPSQFRIDGPLSDMPEFYKAFGVKEGDGMYRPADQRPVIW